MKTYLVTGGAGFIGANFIHFLLRKYRDILVVNLDKLTYAGNLENLKEIEQDSRYIFRQGDITDETLVTELFAQHDFDRVINFAAESHVDRSIENPTVFASTNIMGTLNLLNCAKKAWRLETGFKPDKKFLQVSTDEVYGSLGETGYFTEETPLNPHSPYSSSKAAADLLVKAYFDTYGLPVNITRCSNNYGPYQFPEKLIPLMINNCLRHEPLPVYGSGLNVRDWIYVGDHCRAIDLVAEGGNHGEIYNIGGHNERTNIHIVKTIINYLHETLDPSINEGLIRYVTDRQGHDWRYAIDPAKIKRELGWSPEVAFEDGIVMTILWYLEHQDWITHITSGAYRDYYQRMYGGRLGGDAA